jgi:hypothetical protein
MVQFGFRGGRGVAKRGALSPIVYAVVTLLRRAALARCEWRGRDDCVQERTSVRWEDRLGSGGVSLADRAW